MKTIPAVLLGFILMGSQVQGAAEGQMLSKDLSLKSRFYFAEEKDEKIDVLFMEYTFKNTGKTSLIFTLYNSEFYVTDIKADKKLVKTKINRPCGAPSAPKPEAVIRLAPGQEKTMTSWAWADGVFPCLAQRQGDMVEYYTIPDQTEISAQLCIDLMDMTDVFNQFKYLKPGERLLEGKLCSNTIQFKYKVIKEWRITWSTHIEIDPGGGTSTGTTHHVVTWSPFGARENEEGTQQGIPYKKQERTSMVDSKQREAIALLLPQLEGKAGSYSLSSFVDDEGSHREELTVVWGEEEWQFLLNQGRSDPKPPEALAKLYTLVTGGKLMK